MSQFGNATPRDMTTPVSVFNKGAAFEFQHNGATYTIRKGHSILDAHLAERVVKRNPTVIYGSVGSDVAAPAESLVRAVPEPAANESAVERATRLGETVPPEEFIKRNENVSPAERARLNVPLDERQHGPSETPAEVAKRDHYEALAEPAGTFAPLDGAASRPNVFDANGEPIAEPGVPVIPEVPKVKPGLLPGRQGRRRK